MTSEILKRLCRHKNSDFKIGEESEGVQSSFRAEVSGLAHSRRSETGKCGLCKDTNLFGEYLGRGSKMRIENIGRRLQAE